MPSTANRESKGRLSRQLNTNTVHPDPIRMWPSNHLDSVNWSLLEFYAGVMEAEVDIKNINLLRSNK